MGIYILRRLVHLIPTLIGVSIVVFLIMRLVPGDPARLAAGPDATAADIAVVREKLGLDKPWPLQYAIFAAGLLHGDLGRSTRTNIPATQEILSRLPATVELTVAAMVVAVAIGLVAGVVAAVRRNSWLDFGSMVVALLGVCTPSFWLGLMLMLVFAVQLRWVPATGMGSPAHLVLPAVTLGTGAAAMIARVTRSTMLEVLSEDYIRTARAKGLVEQVVLVRHALRNAMIPVLTVIGLQVGFLLAGAVVVENVFAWPGLGRLLVDSIEFRDYPVVQGAVLLFSLQFVLVNLVVDVLYAFLDPRIAYG